MAAVIAAADATQLVAVEISRLTISGMTLLAAAAVIGTTAKISCKTETILLCSNE